MYGLCILAVELDIEFVMENIFYFPEVLFHDNNEEMPSWVKNYDCFTKPNVWDLFI